MLNVTKRLLHAACLLGSLLHLHHSGEAHPPHSGSHVTWNRRDAVIAA